MCVEYSPSGYVTSRATLLERIAALDVLILNTIALSLDTVEVGNMAMYELDDGQVRIKTTYRSIDDVQKGLKALETMKQMYINQLPGGRKTTLRSRSTINGGFGCC